MRKIVMLCCLIALLLAISETAEAQFGKIRTGNTTEKIDSLGTTPKKVLSSNNYRHRIHIMHIAGTTDIQAHTDSTKLADGTYLFRLSAGDVYVDGWQSSLVGTYELWMKTDSGIDSVSVWEQ